jgi:hypothetical protein
MEELRKNRQILTRNCSKHNNTTRPSRYKDSREGGMRLIRGGDGPDRTLDAARFSSPDLRQLLTAADRGITD